MDGDSAFYLDTSTLAKWYIDEPLSDSVDKFLANYQQAQISTLSRLEMRSLLARRRRAGELTSEQVDKIVAAFHQDIADGYLVVHKVEDADVLNAADLIETLQPHPLRSLDALHLCLARIHGCSRLVTSDRIMAEAAEACGFEVIQFIP